MLLTLVFFIGLHASAAGAGPHYVDCAAGNDAAGGLSPATAWRSTERASRQIYRPGDSLLFLRGTTCAGTLSPQGSGTAAAPIRLGAWGRGPLPKIAASPGADALFKLVDQEYWHIEDLEFIGGNPHGVFVSGADGVLHGIHIRDIVVHDVTGDPKTKEGGLLVVAPGSTHQRFDDVVIDGVVAYKTSQWVGILVGGVNFGFLPEAARSTNVTVRNSIVHDVQGDGIILFQVNNGLIDNSVAWRTGMQATETIGTPDGIWTWMCRNCTVQRSEAFLTYSPGFDGGAFDIDYGSENTTVADSYGHDTQGYCVGVFGASWVTSNSAVRNNVCVNNGLSPALAKRQGAIYLTTWDKGKLNGLAIEGNRIDWTPAADAPLLVNEAEIDGTAIFANNVVRSAVPSMIASNAALKMDGGTYDFDGHAKTMWRYGGKTYDSFASFREGSGQDAGGREGIWRVDGVERVDGDGPPRLADAYHGQWLLLGFVDTASRGMVTLLESAQVQFRASGLRVALAAAERPAENLKWDWHLGDIPLLFDKSGAAAIPSVVLINPQGRVVWRHTGQVLPGDLGLALRLRLGKPDYARMEGE